MFKLSEKSKKNISESTGIPYEKLIDMDEEEITTILEQKNGKKMGYSRLGPRFSGSGDDSVLIDLGRYTTTELVNKNLDKIIKHNKLKITKQPKSKSIEEGLSK